MFSPSPKFKQAELVIQFLNTGERFWRIPIDCFMPLVGIFVSVAAQGLLFICHVTGGWKPEQYFVRDIELSQDEIQILKLDHKQTSYDQVEIFKVFSAVFQIFTLAP